MVDKIHLADKVGSKVIYSVLVLIGEGEKSLFLFYQILKTIARSLKNALYNINNHMPNLQDYTK